MSVLRSLLKDVSHYFSRQAVNQRLGELATRINPCDKYGRCMGCGQCKPPHYIPCGKEGESRFPYCVDCHLSLSVSEKCWLIDQLVLQWNGHPLEEHPGIQRERDVLRVNVEAGL